MSEFNVRRLQFAVSGPSGYFTHNRTFKRRQHSFILIEKG
jgi:hypothetical protein